MATYPTVDPALFENASFLDEVDPADTLYFLLNVGNGDTQLLLSAADGDGARTAVIVDIATRKKLPPLLGELIGTPLFAQGSRVALLVATHPHQDHMGGVPELLESWAGPIDEYWDPGYRRPLPAYQNTMRLLEERGIEITHPAAGTQRYIAGMLITAMSPSIGTKNRFDTYGVDTNNASIALRVEFPMKRAGAPTALAPSVGRIYKPLHRHLQRLILGADAQTAAWATVTTDFPSVHESSPVSEHLTKFLPKEPLRSKLFKVPHHASKRGLNLELIERIDPGLSLISAKASHSGHAFPHDVAMHQLREALHPIATQGGSVRYPPDNEIGIHLTGGKYRTNGGAKALGSIAVVISPTGRKTELWRFRDPPTKPVDLDLAWRLL